MLGTGLVHPGFCFAFVKRSFLPCLRACFICCSSPSPLPCPALQATPPVWKAINTRLDDSQLAAISHALAAQDVALIHGPPGACVALPQGPYPSTQRDRPPCRQRAHDEQVKKDRTCRHPRSSSTWFIVPSATTGRPIALRQPSRSHPRACMPLNIASHGRICNHALSCQSGSGAAIVFLHLHATDPRVGLRPSADPAATSVWPGLYKSATAALGPPRICWVYVARPVDRFVGLTLKSHPALQAWG